MTSHYHAIVWIDHHEARVFHFDHSGAERQVIHPDKPVAHIHHKANSIGAGHAAEDQDFLHRVASAVSDAAAFLVTGPGSAKTELIKHIHRHDPQLSERLAGVETVDHPTDKELIAHARATFKDDHQKLPRTH